MEDVSRIDGEAEPKFKYRITNRATLLIIDRTFDLAGPLMHEYSYWNFIQELMDGDPTTLMKGKKTENAFFFNQDDPHWQRYKTVNIASAMVGLEKQITDYQQENEAYQQLKKKKEAGEEESKQGKTEDDILLAQDLPELKKTNAQFN